MGSFLIKLQSHRVKVSWQIFLVKMEVLQIIKLIRQNYEPQYYFTEKSTWVSSPYSKAAIQGQTLIYETIWVVYSCLHCWILSLLAKEEKVDLAVYGYVLFGSCLWVLLKAASCLWQPVGLLMSACSVCVVVCLLWTGFVAGL